MSGPPSSATRRRAPGRITHPSHEDPVVRHASEVVGGPVGRHWRPHPWWTPVRVVLAVACVAFVLAMVQKAPCDRTGWDGSNSRYAKMCYTDLPFLYVSRGFAERHLPFTDSGGRYPALEYPVLIGYFAYGAAVVDQVVAGAKDVADRGEVPVASIGADPQVEKERQAYFLVSAVLLAPFALLAAYFLAGAHRGRPWDAMAFAASPALVLAGLVNWDLVAVACVAGAFWAWARGRPVLSGVLIGLGTAAKLYPLFLLGALLVVAIRRRTLPDVGRAAAGAAVAWLLVNLPALLGDLDQWKGFWQFNSGRGADLGSLWLVVVHRGHEVSPHTINVVSWIVFLAVCVGVLVLGLVAKHPPRIAQLAFLVLVGFLLVNKVYSPQYVLWLLPVAVLARPRWRDLLIWQAGEVFYFVMVWLYLGGYTASGTSGAQDSAYTFAILVRVAAELYLVAVVVRDVLRPWHDPARTHLAEDPMYPDPGGRQALTRS